MRKLVAATNNKNKLKELRALLADLYDVISLAEAGISVEIEETGATFGENALIKANAVRKLCGLPVISDDSGLCVNALDGAPGVYSARYAGEPTDDERNNEKLLKALADKTDRSASFVSCVAYVDDEHSVTAFGSVAGTILKAGRGQGGFGYDPLFYCPEIGKTFGEATDEEKNSISHRARALAALRDKLCSFT